jgi:hypothetical protein
MIAARPCLWLLSYAGALSTYSTRSTPPGRPVNPAEYAVKTTSRIVTVVRYDFVSLGTTTSLYRSVIEYVSTVAATGLGRPCLARSVRCASPSLHHSERKRKEHIRRRFCTTFVDIVAPTHYETRRSQRDTHGKSTLTPTPSS